MKATESTNPSDCICRYVHASNTYCRSEQPSQGAVPESKRQFPTPTTGRTNFPDTEESRAALIREAGAKAADDLGLTGRPT